MPDSLDAEDAWLLRGYGEVATESLLDSWGNTDQGLTTDEYRVWLADQRYARKIFLVAVQDDPHDAPDPARVLGVARVQMPLTDNTFTAFVDVAVRPAARSGGIGTALHAAALDLVRDAGRTQVTASTDQRTEPAPGPSTLAPATGHGLVDRGQPGVRFVLSQQYTLEQVARYSVLDVPLDPTRLAELGTRAAAAAGPDYRTVSWEGRCPERLVAGFATLLARMSTDAPHGDVEVEEEAWDATRVEAMQDQLERRGRQYRVTAAEHVPSGRLVAFTSFMCPTRSREYVEQDDTLVLREHRGHRLGMLVKVVNLQRLASSRPEVRRVGTWNAQENAHMLAINATLGFRAAGGSGEWQRRLG